MEHIDNRPEQIAIRKAQNNLIVVGSGTILFGVWSGLKMFGSVLMLRNETVSDFKRVIDVDYTGMPDSAVFGAILVIAFVLFAIDILFRLYIGRSAIAEGRGKKKSPVYLLAAGIMITFSTLGIVKSLRAPDEITVIGALMPRVTITSIVIELTSTIMLTEMIVSAIRIRGLRRAEKNRKIAEAGD